MQDIELIIYKLAAVRANLEGIAHMESLPSKLTPKDIAKDCLNHLSEVEKACDRLALTPIHGTN